MVDQPQVDLTGTTTTTTNTQVGKRLLAYLRPHKTKLILGLLCGILAGLVPLGVGLMIEQFAAAASPPALVSGVVRDNATGQPLAGARVVVVPPASHDPKKRATPVTVVSDQKGAWQVSAKTTGLPLALVCAALVALYTALWGFSYGQSVLLAEVTQRVGMQMRGDVYAHLQSLPLAYFKQRRTGALMSTLTNDVPKLQNAAMMIKDVVATPLMVIVFLGMLFATSWKLTLLALAVVPLMALAIQLLTKRLRGISNRSQQKMADVSALMEETLAGARVVKAFTAERHEIERFRHENEAALNVSMSGVRRGARLRPTVDLIGALGIAFTLWVGGREVALNHLSFPQLLKFIFMSVQLSNAVGAVGNLRVAWEEMMGAADRIFGGVLDVVPDVRDAPGATPLPPVRGHVEFRDVSFSYVAGQPTLSNISFAIEPGQVVALVGPTGAGKSTLADLLPRFYDPSGGTVLIDGHDIRGVTLDSLRGQIGIVPQDTLLFSGTIRDNIAYGRREASHAQIVAAARAANADSFIESYPLQYETVIGERGATLSGGERQRVAIARALLADPRILILDEATSSLDAATEALVQEALETLMKNRTTLVIAHRLSTIVNADKIVVLRRGGRIEEVGTHAALIRSGGLYARLYETQRRDAELFLPEP